MIASRVAENYYEIKLLLSPWNDVEITRAAISPCIINFRLGSWSHGAQTIMQILPEVHVVKAIKEI